MMKIIAMIAFVMMLAACQSEIDKCVDAGVKADSVNYPNLTKAERVENEYLYRMRCLRAQGGK